MHGRTIHIHVSHLFFFIQETNFDDTEVNVYVCLLQCTAIKKIRES